MDPDDEVSDELLRTARLDIFVPHTGTDFRIPIPDGDAIILHLITAQPLVESEHMPDSMRPPFSLIFAGPVSSPLSQRTYEVEHDALGKFQLFLVPIEPEEDQRRYEAVFA